MISYKKVLFTGILGLTTVLLVGWFFSADTVKGDDVLVTATVGAVTCSVDATSTALGTLRTDQISTASPDIVATMACGSVPTGCTLYVNDAGDTSNPGLYSSGASYLVTSTDATLSAGSEGYGIQATTTDPGWTINPKYVVTGTDVGGLTIGNTTYASSSSGLSTSTATTTHKAAIATTTPAGSYVDTITYSCTAN